MKKHIKITDENGYVWVWNGQRVFMVEAEKEFKRDRIPVSENGYHASSLDGALNELVEGGYITVAMKLKILIDNIA